MAKKIWLAAILLLVTMGMVSYAMGGRQATTGEPIRFTYLSPVFGPATWTPDSDFAKIFFEMANVSIDIHGIPFTDYPTQWPTVIAGGAIPDLFWNPGPLEPVQYDIIEQGAVAALDDYLDDYPNLKGAFPESYWNEARSPDGKIYCMPIGHVVVPYVPFGIRYRKDLWAKYNLGVPATLDEFVEDMKTIVNREPDVDIGLTADYYDPWAFQNIGPAFGYGFGNWRPAPGESMTNPKKIIPSDVSPEYKEFLRWKNMLRKTGLMDPDYMLIKGPGGDDKFKKGQAAAVIGGWWAYYDEMKDLISHNPDWDLGMLPSMRGPKGMTGCTTLTPVMYYVSISSKANAREVLSYLDWYYSKEGYAFMQRGVWGKMFEILDDKGALKDKQARFYGILDEEREEGFKLMNHKVWQFAPKAEDIYIELRSQYINTYRLLKENNPKKLTDLQLREKAYNMMMEIQVMYQQAAQYTFPDYSRKMFSETRAKIGAQLQEQYITPMRDTLLIDPNADVDKLFDTAIANWYKDGGDKIVDEVNAQLTNKSKPQDPKLTILYSDWSKADFINMSDQEMAPKDFFDFLPVPEGTNPIPPFPEYYVFK